MAHTTNVYYRDRLGFEPDFEPERRQYSSSNQKVVSAVSEMTSTTTRSSTSVRHIRTSGQLTSSSTHHSNNGTAAVASKHYTSDSSHYQLESDAMMKGGVYEENLTKFKGRTVYM